MVQSLKCADLTACMKHYSDVCIGQVYFISLIVGFLWAFCDRLLTATSWPRSQALLIIEANQVQMDARMKIHLL